MPLRILCKDNPVRTIVLQADDHALTLQYVPTTAASETLSGVAFSNVHPPKCIVEFSSTSSLDLKEFRTLGVGQGTLGLITLNSDVFICIITHSTRVGTVRPGETVQRIDVVEFYCLNRPDYDTVLDYEGRPIPGYHSAEERDYGTSYQGYDVVTENPFTALKKLLDDGSFYYSVDFNLTNRIQDRVDDAVAFDIESHDQDFLWNYYMIGPLLQFRARLSEQDRKVLDSSRILTSVIRGFVNSFTIPASAPLFRDLDSTLPSSLTVISRLSSRRAGTRFNSRGIDDDGCVANFVETETILWVPSGLCFSYTQIRGSVPIFWEQAPGLIPGQQKIQITRSVGATQPAFDKHFEVLALDYGAVNAVNLLARGKPGEAEISDRYLHHINHSPLRHERESGASSEHHLLSLTEYDFHAATRGAAGYESANLIRNKIGDAAEGFAYFLSEDAPNESEPSFQHAARDKATVVLQQEGVFRTNCLDCLDRTNLVQTMISRMALEQFFEQRDGAVSPDFWMRHSTLWADNGDSLSKIYAGTGALKSSFTRHGKMSLAGAIADARKSATRLYVNNFADKGRQNTIDMLLGTLMGQAAVHLYDPVKDLVDEELKRRTVEFTSNKKIRIWAGTFNVNGQSHGAMEDLSPWLHASLDKYTGDPAIVAVGLQEIVELSPQQIMSTDPSTRRIWEDAVKETLNERTAREGTGEYVLLRSGQLVGAALLLFVKEDVVGSIKNVEGSVKKTGLSGMGGNKGGCSIRLEYSNTRICFVTAHLAAGFSNYEERNRDYQTIAHGLRFQRDRAIADHDTIIWLGDFNYRIGLNDDRVRSLIKTGDLETLYENDQLNLQMVAGLTFQYYSESPITFNPTYRYNNGTDIYDTSEKRRIPAWCDRILWKGSNLRQLKYDAAPLIFSDHRPVYGIFECIISIVDERMKEKINRQLYDKQKSEGFTAVANLGFEETDEEEAVAGRAVAPGLPLSSSDRRKWWLDHGLPAKSTVSPGAGYMANSQRVVNPFSTTPETDWIHIQHTGSADDAESRNKLGSSSSPRHPSPSKNLPLRSASTLIEATNSTTIPPRRSTSLLSEAIKVAEKPKKPGPPPVPQKPAQLSTTRTPRSGLSPVATQNASFATQPNVKADYRPPLPARRPTVEMEQQDLITTPVMQYTTAPVRSGTVGSQKTRERPPPPPAPRRVTDSSRQVSQTGLMDSDVEKDLAAWKPLRPQK